MFGLLARIVIHLGHFAEVVVIPKTVSFFIMSVYFCGSVCSFNILMFSCYCFLQSVFNLFVWPMFGPSSHNQQETIVQASTNKSARAWILSKLNLLQYKILYLLW